MPFWASCSPLGLDASVFALVHSVSCVGRPVGDPSQVPKLVAEKMAAISIFGPKRRPNGFGRVGSDHDEFSKVRFQL